MVVVEQPDVVAFDIFIEQLHHVDHFFWRVFGADHDVYTFEISFTFEVSAVTVDRGHQNKRSNCRHNHDDRSNNADGCICADCRHDVHREKFFAVATILDISVAPHYVGQLMCDDCSQLRLVIDKDNQSGSDVYRTVWECESVRLRVAEHAKIPRHPLQFESLRNQRLPDAPYISIRSFVMQHEPITLQLVIEQNR